MFHNLDYKKWCLDNKINELFGIDLNAYGKITKKVQRGIYEAPDPKNNIPYSPELDDLTRLHFLARSRKVTTILEFGVGKSTLVFADAIKRNKEEFGEYINNFKLHEALAYIWKYIDDTNTLVNDRVPWKEVKENPV